MTGIANTPAGPKRASETPAGKKLSELLLAKLREGGYEPSANSRVRAALKTAGVARTSEFTRIVNLPRRQLVEGVDFGLLAEMQKYHVRTPCKGCRLCKLRPVVMRRIQALALREARLMDGLFGNLAVGDGKTLIALLLPAAMDAKKAVILTKPGLKKQLEEVDGAVYSNHFAIPWDRLSIVSYTELSSAKRDKDGGILGQIKPDLIIADEAQSLRDKKAAGAGRFYRFLEDSPGTKLCFLSGTLMGGKSIKGFAEFMERALGHNSPMPKWPDLGDWAGALDEPIGDAPGFSPGVLLEMCTEEELEKAFDDVQAVRWAFSRRLNDSCGVIITGGKDSVRASLTVRSVELRPSKPVREALSHLDKLWMWDGNEYSEALLKAKVAKELALGFFYRWIWPDGVKDLEWLDARNNWNREVRETLAGRKRREGFDSPMLLWNAAARGDWESETWAAWAAVRDRPEPPVEPIWISQHAVLRALEWAAEKTPGVVWSSHVAFGERVARVGGLQYFGAGDSPRLLSYLGEIERGRQPESIVCSIDAHATGKNIQAWCRMLVTSPSSNPDENEQLLGRLHRTGQEAECVTADYWMGCEENMKALDAATEAALVLQDRSNQKYKLCYADREAVYEEEIQSEDEI